MPRINQRMRSVSSDNSDELQNSTIELNDQRISSLLQIPNSSFMSFSSDNNVQQDEISERSQQDEEENEKNMENTFFPASNKCFICGKESFYKNQSGMSLCENHVQKFLSKCDRCGDYFDKADISYINGRNMCCYCLQHRSYYFCNKCHNWVKDITIIENVGAFCRECVNQMQTFYCRSCDKTYLMQRYGTNDRCINCINSNLTQVHNYSYKPQPRFFRKQNMVDEELFFGIQLQMGDVSDYQIVNDFVAEYSNSFFYMKKDTSIPVYGCQIVTQPATLMRHIDSRYWKPMLTVAKQYGFSADNDKCGIHIHISRNFFTNYQVAKLDCFINTYKFFRKIARRQSHYSEYLQKQNDCWGSQITNRKCALNLSNSNTIQIRIFKGTLQYQYIMAYIELCHAISIFIKTISMEQILNQKQVVISKFRKLLQSDRYKYINNYCQSFNVFGD